MKKFKISTHPINEEGRTLFGVTINIVLISCSKEDAIDIAETITESNQQWSVIEQ